MLELFFLVTQNDFLDRQTQNSVIPARLPKRSGGQAKAGIQLWMPD
ncbi:MAG: hypothetical protein KGJ59_05640 [Bacteroidota bacterium]|nr:hypothetical protein [Bacteroidota bacterium]